jgi:phage tail-like protein
MPDPYRNFKFEVEIDGFVRAGFSKVTGLSRTTEEISYREGGENETPHKLPGQTSFGDITLERGISDDDDFQSWSDTIFNVDQANGEQGGEDFRRKVVIYLKNKAGERRVKWTVFRAWPKELSAGDLDANANDVEIESMVLANEGIKRESL